jgi:hypothetical protein
LLEVGQSEVTAPTNNAEVKNSPWGHLSPVRARVAIAGRVDRVEGAALQRWIAPRRQERNGPQGPVVPAETDARTWPPKVNCPRTSVAHTGGASPRLKAKRGISAGALDGRVARIAQLSRLQGTNPSPADSRCGDSASKWKCRTLAHFSGGAKRSFEAFSVHKRIWCSSKMQWR